MIKGSGFPRICCVALSAVTIELIIDMAGIIDTQKVGLMATIAFRGSSAVTGLVTGTAVNHCMRTREGESGRVMIKRSGLPGLGRVT